MNRYFLALLLLALLIGCTPPEKVKYERYRVAGERLYQQHCANCHKMDGSGFQKLYPPISGTNWIIDNYEETFCLIKNGMNEPLTINGETYTLSMSGTKLTPLEIAEIATFMYNSWGFEEGLIDVAEVEAILDDCE